MGSLSGFQIAVREVFSRPTRGLERLTDNSDIPWNQPTSFHPSRIATVLQKFLP